MALLRRTVLGLFLCSFMVTALFAQNNHSHIYYYGWFDGLWDRVDGSLGQPTLTNNCANFTTDNHYHPGDTNNDIFTSFWPNINPYDSGDAATIATHRGNIQNAEMKAVIVSYGRNGQPDLNRVNLIADTMTTGTLRLAFAIRDYSNRTAQKVSEDILNLLAEVTSTQRYRVLYNTWVEKGNTYRPVFYLYNAIGASSNWGDYFLANKTFRQQNDFIVLGMAATATQISSFGFDGQYNYTPAKTKSLSFTIRKQTRHILVSVLMTLSSSPQESRQATTHTAQKQIISANNVGRAPTLRN